MDVLVMWDEEGVPADALAHVNSGPNSRDGEPVAYRDVVTLSAMPTAQALSLALAAIVETRRSPGAPAASAIQDVSVWPDRGATGSLSWTDSLGAFVTHVVEIPNDRLHSAAAQLMAVWGAGIQRLAAGLAMPDWPDDALRALNISLAVPLELGFADGPVDDMIERLREADSFAFEFQGD